MHCFRWEILNLSLSMIQKFAELDTPQDDHLAVFLLIKVFRVCLHPFRLPSLPLPLLFTQFPPFLTLLHCGSLFHTLHPMVVDMCLSNVSDSVSPTLSHGSI